MKVVSLYCLDREGSAGDEADVWGWASVDITWGFLGTSVSVSTTIEM